MENAHDYLMGFALHAATKSKDSTKVGAALVGPDGEVRLTGYNGPPRGVRDMPERFVRPEKYLFASHAEQNVIAFAAREGIRTYGCTLYVTHLPCSSCARSIIQSGIRKVVCGDGTTSMPAEEFDAAIRMFREASVEVDGDLTLDLEPRESMSVVIPKNPATAQEAFNVLNALRAHVSQLDPIARRLFAEEKAHG